MNTPIQYKDLSAYSDKIGAVTIGGLPFQLCDYIEFVNGHWFAVAYFAEKGLFDKKILAQANILTAELPGKDDDSFQLAYVPRAQLERAIPQYNDEGNTKALVDRLKKELTKLEVAQGKNDHTR